ncbi:MAG: NfeD family protein [Sphingobacteriales bacterium]|nr:MAG: NfeD family protein [Sphingobacteriales bacterium]
MKNLNLLIGLTGTAATVLRFNGYIIIDNERYVARSQVWIEAGTIVIVRKVEFNQLIVSPLV